MIKECKVISYNKFLHILVFEFGSKNIQTTAIIDESEKTVCVDYSNGRYIVVSKDEYDKSKENLQAKASVNIKAAKPAKRKQVIVEE